MTDKNSSIKKILVIDDNADLRLLLKRFLSSKGYEVAEASSGRSGLAQLQSNAVDLVLCDFKLDDMDGSSVLKAIKEFNALIPVIIITGYSNIKTAVEVMRLGAIDYITKPLVPDELLATIKSMLKAREDVAVTSSEYPTEKALSSKKKNDDVKPYIFSNSDDFKKVLKEIDLVAPTNYCVIIYGESGSGKESIAQEIHKRSKRNGKPFHAIDCGALSKELAGSTMFGHEKGAFTGAVTQKIGTFELANGGTVFLDEIANLSYDVQVSLLRVIQERKMRRVGGVKDIELDIRIIVASNRKLWDAARNGEFREDLYHRFNEFAIDLLPLRERKADIMFYAKYFLQQANVELNKNVKGFDAEVENIFINYLWYGNLRELKNVVKRATLLSDGQYIEIKDIPFEITNFNKLQFEPSPVQNVSPPKPSQQRVPLQPSSPLKDTSLKSVTMRTEYEAIMNALIKAKFNKSVASKLLNIDRKTLYNKIKQHPDLSQYADIE